MPPIIQAESISRQFGERLAVDAVNLCIERGEVFGLLGPNGAGKTTLVRLLNGVLHPTAGRARVFELDPTRDGEPIRLRTGVLTEQPALYERLTARQNLHFFGTLYDVPAETLPRRVEELLKLFDLHERGDDKTGGYSKGMKQRLALARTLIHEPELLYFDEPTSGLDPEASKQVDDLLEQLSKGAGRTIFLCTHNLTQAERLCTRVGIINHGRLLAVGTPAELAGQLWRGWQVEFELFAPLTNALTLLQSRPGVLAVEQTGLLLRAQLAEEAVIPSAVTALVNAGGQVRRVQPRHYTLADIYFQVQELAEAEQGASA